MNYKEAMDFIEEKNKLGSVLGLESIEELLRRLDNPQDDIKIIHIAGTNGKGSILSFLEGILEEVGCNVGRYISPTIFAYLERFQINREYMKEEEFIEYVSIVKEIVEDMVSEGKSSPTAFEIETAIGFLYFKSSKVDFVLLETGMGGRLDATNIIKEPVCTILSSIGMDHMQFLGETIQEITFEKAGILKSNIPCVVYPNSDIVLNIINEQAIIKNVELTIIDENNILIEDENIEFSQFVYKDREYIIKLIGNHQIKNAITALEVANILAQSHKKYSWNEKNITQGLEKTRWQGRFEVIGKEPFVIRDGAHNVDGAIALAKTIEKHFTNKKIVYIIGMLSDKEFDKVLSITAPLAQLIYAISTEGKRGLEGKILATCASKYCNNVFNRQEDSIQEVIKDAIKAAGRDGVVVIFGSLSYIGNITI